MKKRVLAILLALAMVAALLPAAALAADEEAEMGGQKGSLKSLIEDLTAGSGSVTITLLRDVTLTAESLIKIPSGCDITINGKGKTIFFQP